MAESKVPNPFPPPLPSGPESGNPANAQQAVSDDKPIAPDKQQQAQQKKPKYHTTYGANYIKSGTFDHDISIFQGCSNLKTGYDNLDMQQPFYPGLYCLGAISSLGKTTFAHQLADQVAEMGRDVLYFSMEQSRFELISKSLARGFAKSYLDEVKKNGSSQYPTPSSIDIRRGLTTDFPDKMAAQMDAYAIAVGNRLCVVDGAFSLTAEDIRTITEDHMKKPGMAPVVIVDYLQIIAPTLINGRVPDTKTSIDHIVHTMKVMQRDFNLPVLLISSLNRSNYMTPIDFESFKESGGIEYTADVMWGLQLSILNDDIFSKEGKIKEKREKIREAKARQRRKIDLVCLKNRYGVSSYTLPFTYIPACDYFISEKPDP